MHNLINFLKQHISAELVTLERAGGYSAENYVATCDKGQKYFVKLLRENAQGYISKLRTIVEKLEKYPEIPFFNPIIVNDAYNVIVFPYIDGQVFHGLSITPTHCESIVSKILVNFASVDTNGLKDHSGIVFKNLASSVTEINNILNSIQPDNKYYQIITDILNLKLCLIAKYAHDVELINWMEQADSFVHGDFHNENIIFKNDDVAAVIDFELAHRGHLAEDPINFVWFAFLNSDFSAENLRRAREFLKLAREKLNLTDTDIINGFKFLYIKLFSSTFLESALLKFGDDFYAGLLQRDIKKYKYIDDNLAMIIIALLNG